MGQEPAFGRRPLFKGRCRMASQGSVQPIRRFDIDWLRLLAVFMLFFFHSTRIFDVYEQFYAKSSQTSGLLTFLFLDLVNPWFMPLFFTLAGASTFFALGFRSAGQYAGERFRRLFIPFVFGLLVIVPPQSYLGLRGHSDYGASFISYYPSFFRIIPQDLDGYFLGGFTFGHLWFIIYLFVDSMVALPLFVYFRGERGGRLARRLGRFFSPPAMIFLPAFLPIIMGLIVDLNPNPLYYLAFFVYGYVLMTDPRLGEAIDRHKAAALVLGLGLYLIWLTWLWIRHPAVPWQLAFFLDLHKGLLPWISLVAILGYGRKFFSFSNRFLRYFAQASYPYYFLHQTVIVVLGFYILKWRVGLGFKYAAIVAASFLVTAAFYDLAIKRFQVTRFLFGLKSAPGPPRSSGAVLGPSSG
jgi:glucan biosynthesis protein C